MGKIHVVALLTTPDKTSHLPILYHINRMANDAEFIEELVKLEDVNEISKAIRNFQLMIKILRTFLFNY